jgi:UDP-N-acetylglucosamine 2-epimerase (non-hydrolysing)
MAAEKRVMCIFGTRPEAIKMAPVVHELESNEDLECITCVTGQHRDMLDQVLDLFEITPAFDLNIMKAGQDLFDVTSRVLLGLRDVLREARPDVVLVHGDTSTAFSAALAAFYEQIPVGHVEAGLRTGDLTAPFPEEANRVLVDRISQYHFTPTPHSRDLLVREGVDPSGLFVTGNTVIDALLWVRERTKSLSLESFRAPFGSAWHAIADERVPLVLVTGHRRENFGDGFQQICAALGELATRFPSSHFVYPVHLNPNVQAPVNATLGGRDNVHLLKPIDYAPFVRLMDRCSFVLTDSGGIQEEAPSLGKPVLVMREVTERPEGVTAGTVQLVGAQYNQIIDGVSRLLTDPTHYQAMSHAHNPYGDGKASARIAAALLGRRDSFQ